VRTLVRGEMMSADFHRVAWDGTNDNGLSVSTGIYLCHISANKFSASRKMVLVQ